jgi:hypothetical protein
MSSDPEKLLDSDSLFIDGHVETITSSNVLDNENDDIKNIRKSFRTQNEMYALQNLKLEIKRDEGISQIANKKRKRKAEAVQEEEIKE